jgi:glutamine---fructose-6-phosphate transaminase (isomerizing)
MQDNSEGLSNQEWKEEAWTDTDVLQAIRSQELILTRVFPELLKRAQEAVEPLSLSDIQRIFLVGCGDSYYAGLAARMAFERFTGLATDALPSLEFSRYYGRYIDAHSLVFSLSNSGRASRTIETAKVAAHHGALTVGVTGRSQSALAQAAQSVLLQFVETPDLPLGAGSLGLANYMVTLAALYVSMVAISVQRKRLSAEQGSDLIATLTASTSIIGATVEANLASIRQYAAVLAGKPVLYMLGGGPSLATSYFGAAKMYEQPQFEAVPQELEEFAHEQYFMLEEGSHVLMIVPPGASRDRALELIAPIHMRGGIVAVMGDSNDAELRASADYWFPVVGTVEEEFSPLYYIVPLQMLADALVGRSGPGFRRNMRSVDPKVAESMEYARIYGSQLVIK